jgi:benzylsuccinate CoA-transferase BbsF subunit
MSRALPLEGIRIANFGWVWAGPVTGQTLAFLGAEVYKIESYARVDMTRTLPPFGGGQRDPNRSLSNHACWAGNGSVSLNLKKPEAVKLALDLVSRCDVVAENFGPGVMNELGLGYAELCKARPDIVMFSMPAAGLDGPLRDVRTYGLSLTSTTGLDSLTGYVDGPPLPMENAFSDPFNGILGAFAILVALNHRDRTGKGQHIDYSQQEAVMQMVGPAFMDYAMNGRSAAPMGNRPPTVCFRLLARTAGSASRSGATSSGRDSSPPWAIPSGRARRSTPVPPSACETSTRSTNAWRPGRRASTTASSRSASSATG